MARSRPAWTAVPAARSALPVLKLRLYLLLGALCFAALLGIMSTVAWVTAEAPQPDYSRALPRQSGLAELVARDFLDGRSTTYPTAEGIEPTLRGGGRGSDPIPYTAVVHDAWWRDSVGGRLVESHQFLVSFDEGVVHRLTVVIGLDSERPTLVAYPTLQPAFTRRGAVSRPFEYMEQQTVVESIPQPVRNEVGRWASAFVSDDRELLRQIVADPTASTGDYVGLGGFDLVGTPDIRNAVATNDGFVVRVRLVFSVTGADGALLSSDYDLLVTDVNTNLPKVVAWGAPGTGPTLRPYENRR